MVDSLGDSVQPEGGNCVIDQKQVDKSHYEFSRYMCKARWNSVWHQLDEVIRLNPESVLEIGPGIGLFKLVGRLYGVRVETLDIDQELEPDHIGTVTSLPFEDNSYDVVCAFQILEHLPYERSLIGLREMARVSRSKVVISLPDARPVWPYKIHIPKIGVLNLLIPRPFFKEKKHEFDGEHYWEINKRGYSLKKVISDFSSIYGMKLIKTYRVYEFPYHRFLVFDV